MQQVGRVHVLQALQHLVDDILLVDVFENVGSDDGVQIGIHEVEHQVNVSVIFRPNDILQTDDVLVTRQLLEENDLSESSLCIGGILKGVKVLLEGYDLFGALVDRFPDNTISSLTCKGTVNM